MNVATASKAIGSIRPETVEDLAEAVTVAAARSKTFEISGGATKLALGNPVDADSVLDISALKGVVFYEPEELVLKVKAGTPFAEVRALLGEKQQHLAFDPPDYGEVLGTRPDGATIGGIVACNIAGPEPAVEREHRATCCLASKVSTARGEHFKAGGRTVKNVTGYDLPKPDGWISRRAGCAHYGNAKS